MTIIYFIYIEKFFFKMAKLSISISATGSTTLISSYDQNKWSLGTLIKQYTGPTTTDNFIGPYKVAQARPFEEQSTTPYFLTNLS